MGGLPLARGRKSYRQHHHQEQQQPSAHGSQTAVAPPTEWWHTTPKPLSVRLQDGGTPVPDCCRSAYRMVVRMPSSSRSTCSMVGRLAGSGSMHDSASASYCTGQPGGKRSLAPCRHRWAIEVISPTAFDRGALGDHPRSRPWAQFTVSGGAQCTVHLGLRSTHPGDHRRPALRQLSPMHACLYL